MSVRVAGRGSGGGFAEFVAEAVAEHVGATEEQLLEDVREVAKQARAQLRRDSPRGEGARHYADGWSMRTQRKRGHVEAVVYNKDKPGLAHLLEKGHANRDGGRTPGKEHIRPAYEAAERELARRTGAR